MNLTYLGGNWTLIFGVGVWCFIHWTTLSLTIIINEFYNIYIMFVVGDDFRCYSSVYGHAQMLWDTIANLQVLKMSKLHTRKCCLYICKCFEFHLVQVQAFSTRKSVFYMRRWFCIGTRAMHKDFLESTCKESHVHGSFRYFSVFYRANNSCPWCACIGNLYKADTVWHTAGPIRVAVTGPKLLQILA